ncbi:hypothetical protein CHARACLAT_020827, partial [Characodon lateralis]|nr:hypothetical protein [Characodon lateralis]
CRDSEDRSGNCDEGSLLSLQLPKAKGENCPLGGSSVPKETLNWTSLWTLLVKYSHSFKMTDPLPHSNLSKLGRFFYSLL